MERMAVPFIFEVKSPSTDQPISLSRGLVERALLNKWTKYIRHRFIQGARLIIINKSCFIFSDTMCQFMPDNVNRYVNRLKSSPCHRHRPSAVHPRKRCRNLHQNELWRSGTYPDHQWNCDHILHYTCHRWHLPHHKPFNRKISASSWIQHFHSRKILSIFCIIKPVCI